MRKDKLVSYLNHINLKFWTHESKKHGSAMLAPDAVYNRGALTNVGNVT